MASTQLRGRAEVVRREQKLNSIFALVSGAELSPELSAHYARYLCILVAGYAEQSLKVLISEHARKGSRPTVHRSVELSIGRLWGINQTKLKDVLDSFDVDWFGSLAEADERGLSSLQSVGKLRDNISHGSDGGITLATINQYFVDIKGLVRCLCDLLDPT